MKSTLEQGEDGRVVLEIEVSPEEMAPEIDAAFRKLAARVRVAGFRPGRAPTALVERVVPRSQVLEQALQPILRRAYQETLAERSLTPVDQAEIDVKPFEDGQPLQFVVRVTVRPEVRLGAWEEVRVTPEAVEVTPEDLAENLEALRRTRATWVPTTEGAADGDMVLLEISGTVEGAGALRPQRSEVVLGSGRVRPEVQEAVLGMKRGEAADVEIALGADEPVGRLAGKRARLHVQVSEVKRQQLPELDDAFAQEVSAFSTLEEFRADMSNRLRAAAERRARDDAERKAVDLVVDGAQVDVPAVMVAQALEAMLNNLSGAGMKDREVLRDELRGSAERGVRTQLVLQAVAAAAGLEPSDDELTAEINRRAASSNLDPDHYRRLAGQPENLSVIQAELAGAAARERIRILALRPEEDGRAEGATQESGSGKGPEA